MSTGYTYSVAEGNITFKDFLLQCARAFGACVRQRDDDLSVKPQKAKVSDYHKNSLERAEKDLKALKAKSIAFLKAEFKEAVKSGIKYAEKQLIEQKVKRERYEMMLLAAKHWVPPSPDHEGLKNFMISQLTDSLEHDNMEDYYRREIKEWNELKFGDWKRDRLKSAIRSIEYDREHLEKEIEHVEKQNKWIEQLYNSLN